MRKLVESLLHRSRLAREDGVTMLLALGTMVVTAGLIVAAFTSSQGEIRLTSRDTASKKAYYAAEAGISDYTYHLTQDSNYLTYCTTPSPANPALNQVTEGTTHRAVVPAVEEHGELVPSHEEYALDLIPAESAPAIYKTECNRSHLVESMIEQTGAAAGTFRIKSTGFSEGVSRTIIATFRNADFVSFVWYDEFETGDPALYSAPPKEPEKYAVCGQVWGVRPGICNPLNNYFINGESVNGPMHTEDHVGICGSPVFGRTVTDRIEFRHAVGGDSGYSGEEACGGLGTPVFKGTHIPPNEVPSLKPPPGDEELEHIVEAPYHYHEKTKIVLEGTTMTVTTHWGKTTGPESEREHTTSGVPFPPGGVIYVSGGCPTPYSPYGPIPAYNADTACGNLYLSGEYKESLTIASQNDIIINGNITTPVNAEGVPTTTALLGLIANNFIRLYHPLTAERPNAFYSCGAAKNSPKDLNEPTIYAAMLAIKHSVIIDNFDCGEPNKGHFNVYGAVAALFSNGDTGVESAGTLVAGYSYHALYDDRFEAAEPPHFLNPIQAAWYVQRQTLDPPP